MTTPNIDELIDRLYDWHNTSAEQNRLDMQKAADLLQSQAERIKALEAECEVERLRLTACGVAALGYFDGCKDEYKSASLDDVLRLNKRCTDLRAELGDLPEAQAEMLAEIKQLRAQLAEIAAADPVAEVGGTFTLYWIGSGPIEPIVKKYGIKVGDKLFTHPMPARPQDHEIRELVDRLTAIAKGYGQTQQLRERIAQEICPFTFAKPAQDKSDNYLNGYCTGRTDLLKEQAAPQPAQGVPERRR